MVFIFLLWIVKIKEEWFFVVFNYFDKRGRLLNLIVFLNVFRIFYYLRKGVNI